MLNHRHDSLGVRSISGIITVRVSVLHNNVHFNGHKNIYCLLDEKGSTRDGERFEFRELNRLQFRTEHGCQGGKIYVLVEDYSSTFKSERLAILERILPE